jgi:hypothetical protein
VRLLTLDCSQRPRPIFDAFLHSSILLNRSMAHNQNTRQRPKAPPGSLHSQWLARLISDERILLKWSSCTHLIHRPARDQGSRVWYAVSVQFRSPGFSQNFNFNMQSMGRPSISRCDSALLTPHPHALSSFGLRVRRQTGARGSAFRKELGD